MGSQTFVMTTITPVTGASIVSSWGANSSNSYVTWSEANSFITSTAVDYADWTGASSTVQEAAILEATRDVDALQYRGARTYYSQQLEFPREMNKQNNFSRITSPWTEQQVRMQRDVKQATCYQALWILRNSGRNLHAERLANGIKSFSERLGPISEAVTYRGGAPRRVSSDALALLNEWKTSRQIARG